MRYSRANRCITSIAITTVSIWLIGALAACAHDDHDHPQMQTAKVSDQVVHRPTAVPDRMVLTWTGNPSTSQAATWRTDTSVDKAIAEIAVAGAGPKFVEGAKQVDAKTTPLRTDLGKAHYHTAIFDELQPKTKYAYRVGDGVNWSEWNHFTTAASEPEPFTFVYFGDAQTNVKSMWSRVIREAYSDAPKARFLLHAGDLINRANNDAEWGDWFYAGGWIHSTIPAVPTPGNHEYAKLHEDDDDDRLTTHWRPQFALPEHGPEGLEETVYYLDYQGVRIISLNSNEKHQAQKDWLDKVLADNPATWTVVTHHHPLYASEPDRDNEELRELWQPVYDKHSVDLVLQGHDHGYARSKLMTWENFSTGANVRDEETGTVYVVSVSGPKMYDVGREPYFRRVAEDTQLYQIISVDGDELRYEARTAIGDVYDAFTLKKRDGKPNELIDRIPDTPERRREESVEKEEEAEEKGEQEDVENPEEKQEENVTDEAQTAVESEKVEGKKFAEAPEFVNGTDLILAVGYRRNADGEQIDSSPFVFYAGEFVAPSEMGRILEHAASHVRKQQKDSRKINLLIRAESAVPYTTVKGILEQIKDSKFKFENVKLATAKRENP